MKNLLLLIVDHEEASRYGIRRALESFGHEIAEADSAEAARAVMTNANFDLLLLDVNLPGISGLEFLSQLQSDAENNTELPLVIIITAHGSERTPSRLFSFVARINHCGGALRSRVRSVVRCSEIRRRYNRCAR